MAKHRRDSRGRWRPEAARADAGRGRGRRVYRGCYTIEPGQKGLAGWLGDLVARSRKAAQGVTKPASAIASTKETATQDVA
jgi:hypothetical protein